MCGRTALGMNKESLRCACSYKCSKEDTYSKPQWTNEHNNGKEFVPSYNIAPTDITPVLISGAKNQLQKRTHERYLKPMMWGMIPPWHKGDYTKHNLSTNNCRLEGIKTSKLYGPALQNGGRCIVLAEGFYEWQTTDRTTKTKQPFYIYAQQDDSVEVDNKETWSETFSEKTGWKGLKLLHMAAVYSVWQENNTVIYSYSIITMESNKTLDWLHHRMPAILQSEEQIQAWLDIDNVSSDLALSYLLPVEKLSWHPVSNTVNNSRNKQDNLNKRISSNRKEKTSQKLITSWFTKGEKRKSEEILINKNKRQKLDI